MFDKCKMFLLGLMIFCPLFTGFSGAEENHLFFRFGENVRLPCNNALYDCTSTTWTNERHSGTVELISLGIKKTDRERLSLGSDCSLNINNVTKEDYGLYICIQYVYGQQQGENTRIFLQLLHVSSSSSQTEISPGRSVTLSCQLHHHGASCDTLIHREGVDLMWVNQDGVNLMTDSRYQILFSSSLCIITLTTTLLNEDHNREWRCQLTQGNQLKTSVTYTVKYSGPDDTTAGPKVIYRVILIIVEIAVFAAPTVLLLQIIRARRAGNRGQTSVVQKNQLVMQTISE